MNSQLLHIRAGTEQIYSIGRAERLEVLLRGAVVVFPENNIGPAHEYKHEQGERSCKHFGAIARNEEFTRLLLHICNSTRTYLGLQFPLPQYATSEATSILSIAPLCT